MTDEGSGAVGCQELSVEYTAVPVVYIGHSVTGGQVTPCLSCDEIPEKIQNSLVDSEKVCIFANL